VHLLVIVITCTNNARSIKGIHPTTGHKRPGGSFLRAPHFNLDGRFGGGGGFVDNATHKLLYPREGDPVPIVQTGWAPGPF
jgi:hypothetical protein